MHAYYVYILTNIKRTVMYIGVTNDLERRIADHCDGRGGTFTRKYQLNTLVHVEEFQYIDEAIAREKEIKGWRRSKKDALDSVLIKGFPGDARADSLPEVGGEDGAVRLE